MADGQRALELPPDTIAMLDSRDAQELKARRQQGLPVRFADKPASLPSEWKEAV